MKELLEKWEEYKDEVEIDALGLIELNFVDFMIWLQDNLESRDNE